MFRARMVSEARTLEIEGTYEDGILDGTWVYHSPAVVVAAVTGEGPIKSKGKLTKESARATITGSIAVDPVEGPEQTHEQDEITILFTVAE